MSRSLRWYSSASPEAVVCWNTVPSAVSSVPPVCISGPRAMCTQPAAWGDPCPGHPHRGSYMSSREPGACVQGEDSVVISAFMLCSAQPQALFITFVIILKHAGSPCLGHMAYVMWQLQSCGRSYSHKVTNAIQQLLCSELDQ